MAKQNRNQDNNRRLCSALRIPSQTELGVLPSLGSVKSVVQKNAASFSSSPRRSRAIFVIASLLSSTHSAFAAPRKLLAPTFPRYKLPKIPKIPNLKFPPLTPAPLWPEYRLPPPIITSLPNFPLTPTFPFSPPSITTTP
ncbi:unnamed protein product [Prunus armeniaca]|uniref:Uncharacterized protein n=1 Tax=Prunus armeniaca TaxID=36596 RepID=A0A6J5VKW8_PRUAR|nr:unnamed protein product [Prunus armeniaca]